MTGATSRHVGLIGLGRLGRVYARDLAGRIPETRLVAVADPAGIAGGGGRGRIRRRRVTITDPLALIDDPAVDAIVIVTPTHTHREQVIAAADARASRRSARSRRRCRSPKSRR